LKFIHIADVHWGAKPERTKSWGKIREKDIKETFFRMISYANEREMDLLLIAGDFFHNQPTVQDLRDVDYLLGKLTTARVVWIAGNHDHLKEGKPFYEYSWKTPIYFLKDQNLEKVSFSDLQTSVYGFSYWENQIRQPLYDRVKPEDDGNFSILLAHGGDESHIPIDQEKLKWSGFDYIALGHIHRPQIIFEDLMAYAGSMEPLDRTETGQHGFIEGEISEEKQMIHFVPFARRQYMQAEVFISDKMGQAEILDRIETELSYRGKENMYEIVLTGTKDPKLHLDFERVEDSYLISSVHDETRNPWEYDRISGDNDFLVSKVAEILKDHPKALSYAMEALAASRED